MVFYQVWDGDAFNDKDQSKSLTVTGSSHGLIHMNSLLFCWSRHRLFLNVYCIHSPLRKSIHFNVCFESFLFWYLMHDWFKFCPHIRTLMPKDSHVQLTRVDFGRIFPLHHFCCWIEERTATTWQIGNCRWHFSHERYQGIKKNLFCNAFWWVFAVAPKWTIGFRCKWKPKKSGRKRVKWD